MEIQGKPFKWSIWFCLFAVVNHIDTFLWSRIMHSHKKNVNWCTSIRTIAKWRHYSKARIFTLLRLHFRESTSQPQKMSQRFFSRASTLTYISRALGSPNSPYLHTYWGSNNTIRLCLSKKRCYFLMPVVCHAMCEQKAHSHYRSLHLHGQKSEKCLILDFVLKDDIFSFCFQPRCEDIISQWVIK